MTNFKEIIFKDFNTQKILNTILITGANRGIGLGLTEAFLKDGWQVIASYREDKGGLTELQNSFKNELFIRGNINAVTSV